MTTQTNTIAARLEVSGLRMATALYSEISTPRPINGYSVKGFWPSAGKIGIMSRNRKPHSAPISVPDSRFREYSLVSWT